jgi:hypothetical protein
MLLTWINVAADGTVTATVKEDNRTIRYQHGLWVTVASNHRMMQAVAVNAHLMYGSDLTSLFKWDGSSWQLMYPNLHTSYGYFIDAAADGTLLVSSGKQVFRYTGLAWEHLTNLTADGGFVDAGSAHHLSVATGQGWFEWGGNSWQQIEGSLRHISAGADNTVWGVNANNDVWSLHDGKWTQVPGSMKLVAVGSAQHIAGFDPNGQIRLFTNGTWGPPIASPAGGTPLRDISIGSDGTIWICDTLKRAYHSEDGGTTWHHPTVNLELTSVDVVDALHVCGLNYSSALHEDQIWIGSTPLAGDDRPFARALHALAEGKPHAPAPALPPFNHSRILA